MNVHNIVTCMVKTSLRQVQAMTCNSVFTIRLINVVTVVLYARGSKSLCSGF